MFDGLVTDGAAGVFGREVAGDTVAIGGAFPAAAVGGWLCVLVALEAEILFVADGAGAAVPAGA